MVRNDHTDGSQYDFDPPWDQDRLLASLEDALAALGATEDQIAKAVLREPPSASTLTFLRCTASISAPSDNNSNAEGRLAGLIRNGMMDKAAIFTNLTRRNALRKANGLSLLDVHAEYAHEVSIAVQQDYRAACADHADERDAIRQQVLVEYRGKYGPQFGQTMGGRWVIGHLTHKRFTALMAEKHSVLPPDRATGKNRVAYGGDHKSRT